MNQKKEDIHFSAILAKNSIARMLGLEKDSISNSTQAYIMARLKEIEEYTGELNQPSVKDMYEESYDLAKNNPFFS